MRQNTIALVYDFDGTLIPKTMQDYTIIPRLKLRSDKFWSDIMEEAEATDGEVMMIYMRQLITRANSMNIKITKSEFKLMASKIEYFKGVFTWFDNINKYLKNNHKRIKVAHYVISAGHHEILESTAIRKKLTNVFGSQYYFNEQGHATFPKVVVTDTAKTQFLFRINKGKEKVSDSINSHMPEELRPIPFENMIYIGDGLTDVPSMALIKKQNGHAVSVYPRGSKKQKKVSNDLLAAKRVDFIAEANYTRNSILFKRICLIIDMISARIKYRNEVS
ncbi:MAG: haloacid dehalogenase-like hydrolase [Pseudomonadota bacterium]|nr:haloacid dehalogenase-like hydrolase [Pseudomonadota bacterium]